MDSTPGQHGELPIDGPAWKEWPVVAACCQPPQVTLRDHVFRDRLYQGLPHCPWDGVLHPHGMVYISRTVPKGPGVTETVWMNPRTAPVSLHPCCSGSSRPQGSPHRVLPGGHPHLPVHSGHPSREPFLSLLPPLLCPGDRQHSKRKPHQEPTVPAEESWFPHQVSPEHVFALNQPAFALNQHALMSLP